MNSYTSTITKALAPNVRSRLLVGAISLFDWFVNKNLEGYQNYRKTVEYYSGFIPQLKNVKWETDDLNNIPAEWITPLQCRTDRLLYYLHGGGYLVCSTKTHRRLVSKISHEAGIRAVGINYRLAPEHTFPAAIEDSVEGYKAILDKGFSPDKIVIAGDSAGGGLAVSTMVRLRELGLPLPAAAVCLSPWADLEATGKSNIDTREDILDYSKAKEIGQMYMGKENPRHPLASPIYADLKGLPPMLIQVSSNEVLFDDAVRLHQRACSQGVACTLDEWNGLFHVWHAYDFFIPEASMAIKKIAGFINRFT